MLESIEKCHRQGRVFAKIWEFKIELLLKFLLLSNFYLLSIISIQNKISLLEYLNHIDISLRMKTLSLQQRKKLQQVIGLDWNSRTMCSTVYQRPCPKVDQDRLWRPPQLHKISLVKILKFQLKSSMPKSKRNSPIRHQNLRNSLRFRKRCKRS